MRFINRIKELKRLDSLLLSEESSLVVVWGRRRVGKTRLLIEWANKHKGVYFTADESASAVQRKYFSVAIDQVLPGFSSVEYPDWTILFSRLAKEAHQAGWKGPIVIDELPYLIAASPEIPSILQKFIDHEAKQARLLVALCGSSQRMMMSSILNTSAPLYGRAKELIKLRPIGVQYIAEALSLKKARDAIEYYAIWGGIPRYWELISNRDRKLVEDIDRLVLDPMGPLNDEPNRLLLEEIPSAGSLRPILDAIGMGAHRLSEIATRLSQPVTSLTRSMPRLAELGLIDKETPYGAQEHHSKKVLYQISDPFVRFWFRVVAPRKSFFSQAPSQMRIKWVEEALPPLFALNWEELCRLALPMLAQQWVGKYFYPAKRYWQGKGPEWDCVTESEDTKELILAEAKWPGFELSDIKLHQIGNELKNKGIPPIQRDPNGKILYAIFVPEKPKSTLDPEFRVFDAEDVLSALKTQDG